LALRTDADIPQDEHERVKTGLSELSTKLKENLAELEGQTIAAKAARAAIIVAENNADIEAEYRALGRHPVRCSGMLVSPSLLKALTGH